mmetsp:Transcript_46412/g.92088  ORF Transcript_46412/g.92088 Transcript_46412/m.92088 type:complete len:177 (-) Transcript_46412:226-756(-)|eukprot:CAMPEP_0172729766 /NCGR_PEP_ID=MMETSP1074-20121228/95825_1 /TAXON_ID=2916 /ORGANISM="Ceratium fusus, Strain PA161109" /LENGTH=176 /DNA_ID=CAMNT_0013557321 /DNA_START=10 /DNA_END=540 /DNA_ORIENTATION=+
MASLFECNICLEMAAEPVVTRCGHMYCWACLHQWLSTPRRSLVHGGMQADSGVSPCPVCKAAVSIQTVTPVYTRSSTTDPRVAVDPNLPTRPAAERTEVEPANNQEAAEAFVYGGTATRYGFSAGYGQFPVLIMLALTATGQGCLHLLDLSLFTDKRARYIVGTIVFVCLCSMALM